MGMSQKDGINLTRWNVHRKARLILVENDAIVDEYLRIVRPDGYGGPPYLSGSSEKLDLKGRNAYPNLQRQ
jgi:hypothetical protein